MTNPVNAAASQTVETFKDHKVVDGKVRPNKVWINFLRGESNSTIASLQNEFDAEKTAADALSQAAAQKNEKTPVWKLVLGTITGYYVVKFVLGTVASLLSKCFALFSKKAPEQKV